MVLASSLSHRAVRMGSKSGAIGLLLVRAIVRRGLARRLRVLLSLALDDVGLFGLLLRVRLRAAATCAPGVARCLGPRALRGALRSFASAARRRRLAPTPARSPRCRPGPDARSVTVAVGFGRGLRRIPVVGGTEAGEDATG